MAVPSFVGVGGTDQTEVTGPTHVASIAVDDTMFPAGTLADDLVIFVGVARIPSRSTGTHGLQSFTMPAGFTNLSPPSAKTSLTLAPFGPHEVGGGNYRRQVDMCAIRAGDFTPGSFTWTGFTNTLALPLWAGITCLAVRVGPGYYQAAENLLSGPTFHGFGGEPSVPPTGTFAWPAYDQIYLRLLTTSIYPEGDDLDVAVAGGWTEHAQIVMQPTYPYTRLTIASIARPASDAGATTDTIKWTWLDQGALAWATGLRLYLEPAPSAGGAHLGLAV